MNAPLGVQIGAIGAIASGAIWLAKKKRQSKKIAQELEMIQLPWKQLYTVEQNSWVLSNFSSKMAFFKQTYFMYIPILNLD